MELQKSALLEKHKIYLSTLFLYQGAEGKIHLQCFDRHQKLAFECSCVEQVLYGEKHCFFLNGLEKSWYFFKDEFLYERPVRVGQPLFEGDRYYLCAKKQGVVGPEMVFSIFSGSSSHYYGITSFETYSVMYDKDFIFFGDQGYHRLLERKGCSKSAEREVLLKKETSFDAGLSAEGINHVPFKADAVLEMADCAENGVYEIKW